MIARIGLLYASAIAFPGLALMLAAPSDRSAMGLAVRPFGWPELLTVHLLAGLPLAAVLASWIARRIAATNGPVHPVLFVVLGVLTEVLGGVIVSGLGPGVGKLGFEGLSFLRSVLCIAFALPWCIAAAVVWKLGPTSTAILLFAGLVGFVLPGIGADRIASVKAEELRERLGRLRFAQAQTLATGLADLDPERRIEVTDETRPLSAVQKEVDEAVKQLSNVVRRPLPASANPAMKLQRGQALLFLDRPAEAFELFRELAPNDPLARLFLSEACHDLDRFAESDEHLRAVLANLLTEASKDPATAKKCRKIYDDLARNARARRAPAEVEAILREAIEALPTHAAHFHVQLGRHYHSGGRPRDALAQFAEAERLDPSTVQSVQPIVRSIRESTPGCLVGK